MLELSRYARNDKKEEIATHPTDVRNDTVDMSSRGVKRRGQRLAPAVSSRGVKRRGDLKDENYVQILLCLYTHKH